MNYKKIFLFFLLIVPVYLYAQPKDLCSGIDVILKDAPTGFKYIKDTVIKINERGIVWGCKVNVPGVIKGRIISVMGLRYEGALFQSKNKDEVSVAYEQLKKELTVCLSGQGYELSTGDNFYPGLEAYRKLMYTTQGKDDVAPPPHISVETDHSTQTGAYTIVLYIWQH